MIYSPKKQLGEWQRNSWEFQDPKNLKNRPIKHGGFQSIKVPQASLGWFSWKIPSEFLTLWQFLT